MENAGDLVSNVADLCDKLQKGEIGIKDMPLNKIIDMVSAAYGSVSGEGTEYAALFGNLMISCVEKYDIEALINVIMLALRNIVLLPYLKQDRDSNLLKTYQLQSKVGYYNNREKVRKWHERNSGECKIPFNGKGVIYSAITGGYDEVKEPEYINPYLDYILFTDNPNVKSAVWKVKLISKEEGLDEVRMARKIKILGHQYLTDYDFSIWVDGKLSIKSDLYDFVLKNRRKEPLLCFSHYINDCIYQEKELCHGLKKDDPHIMDVQIEKYRKEGYPEHNGLIDSGILVRELKNERVINLMEAWWQEVLHGSKRDQLSFNYACWKNDFVYDTTDLFIYGNEYVKSHSHN